MYCGVAVAPEGSLSRCGPADALRCTAPGHTFLHAELECALKIREMQQKEETADLKNFFK